MQGLASTKNKKRITALATLVIIILPYVHPPATKALQTNTILINEIMYDPEGPDSGFEWIELINTSDEIINLNGWKIQAAGNSFADKAELPEYHVEPGDIVLIGEPNITDADITVQNLSMQNGGSATDGVRIVDTESTVIDTLLYDTPNTNELYDDTGNPGEFFAEDTSSGNSLARISNTDTDNCEVDFIQTEDPTPGDPNTSKPVAIFSIPETVFKNTDIPLDATQSYDLDGSITAWEWVIDHEKSELLKKNGQEAGIIFDQTGEVTITLTVTDNSGFTSTLILESEVIDDPDNPDIIHISEAKTLDTKTVVTIIGTVTAPVPCLYEKETYIQDESGGIRIKLTNDQVIEYEKTYQITGKIGTTYGEKRIEIKEIKLLENSIEILPASIHINDISEDLTGSLISTTGKITQKRGNYLYLALETDNTSTRIYFSKYSGLEVPDNLKESTISITGIVSRYGTNSDGSAKLRIMPRFENDIDNSDEQESLVITGNKISTVITIIAVLLIVLTLLFAISTISTTKTPI